LNRPISDPILYVHQSKRYIWIVTRNPDGDDLYEDRDLIASTLAGNDKAFERLMRRYLPLVIGFYYGKCGPEEAEDLVQEVFLSAYRSLGNLKNRDRIGPWLLATARSRLYDNYRRRRSEKALLQRDPETNGSGPREVASSDPSPAEAAEEKRLLSHIVESIGAMSDKYRPVLYLRLREELSLSEIAELLDLKESTVRMRFSRGLTKLRKTLKRKGVAFLEEE